MTGLFGTNGQFIQLDGRELGLGVIHNHNYGQMSLGENHVLVANGDKTRVVGIDGVSSSLEPIEPETITGINGRIGNDLVINGQISFADGSTNYLLGFNGTDLVAGLRGEGVLGWNQLNVLSSSGNIMGAENQAMLKNIIYLNTGSFSYARDLSNNALIEWNSKGEIAGGWDVSGTGAGARLSVTRSFYSGMADGTYTNITPPRTAALRFVQQVRTQFLSMTRITKFWADMTPVACNLWL